MTLVTFLSFAYIYIVLSKFEKNAIMQRKIINTRDLFVLIFMIGPRRSECIRSARGAVWPSGISHLISLCVSELLRYFLMTVCLMTLLPLIKCVVSIHMYCL